MTSNQSASSLFAEGASACRAGQIKSGVLRLHRAIALDPNNPSLQCNVGMVLASCSEFNAAHEVLKSTILKFPNHAEAYNVLGGVMFHLRNAREAARCWQQALKLDPNLIAAAFNLANLLQRTGQPDAAEEMLRKCVARKPEHAEAWRALAHIRRDLGDIDAAIQCFERASTLRPDDQSCHSALLYSLWFSETRSRREIVEKHVAWARAKADPLASAAQNTPHPNRRDPHRRLRVGYVSPFLRDHVISLLAAVLLANHNREHFEVFAYCNAAESDSHKLALRPYVDHWHQCERMSDEELASVIRRHGIDILVDLNTHMAFPRVLAFARKPAPIQLSCITYPATTGMQAMDYRVSTPFLDPRGTEEPLEPEKLLRLPEIFWCFPTDIAIAISDAPARQSGRIGFGCLNSFAKVRPQCVECWVKILDAVPGSTLALLAQGGQGAPSLVKSLTAHGLRPDRINLLGYADRRAHLERFNQIDISLDTFPYGGHTTTLDSLWMGVPVVTMTGESPVARAGPCILSQIGLESLVANSVSEYVDRAVALANDLRLRTELRATLRPRMLASPLTDAPRFARHLEAAYRAAWRHWCDGLPPADIDVGRIDS